jgi:hypothetical protein
MFIFHTCDEPLIKLYEGFVRWLYLAHAIRLLRPALATSLASLNSRVQMNNPHPIKVQVARAELRNTAHVVRKRALIGSIAMLIVLTMVIWLGLLGWGVVEIIRSATAGVRTLWHNLT